MAEAIGNALSLGGIASIGREVVEPIVDVLYGETVRGLGRVFKLSIGDKLLPLRDMLIQSFARLEDARPKPDFGFSPYGIMDVFMAFIYASTWLSAIIGDELAEELFSEMIQEGISNALQTSYGGTLQTIFNVYRGGTPINPDDIRDVYNIQGMIDDRIIAMNLASSGNNIYAILHYLVAGGVEQVQRNYTALVNQIQQLSLRVLENSIALDEYVITLLRHKIQEYINSQLEGIDYYLTLLNATCESAIARFNDYRTSIMSILSETYEEPVTASEEQCLSIVESVVKSAKQTYDNVRKVFSKVESISKTLTIDIPQEDIEMYVEAVKNLSYKLMTMVNASNLHFISVINNMLKWFKSLIDYVLAYRQKYTTSEVEGVRIEDIAEKPYIDVAEVKLYTLEIIVVEKE